MSDWHAAYTTTYVQVTADMNGSLDTTEEAPGRNSVERIQAIHANASAHADAAAMAARADVVAQQELLLRGGFEEEDSDDDMPQLFEHSQGGHAAWSVSEEEDSDDDMPQLVDHSSDDEDFDTDDSDDDIVYHEHQLEHGPPVSSSAMSVGSTKAYASWITENMMTTRLGLDARAINVTDFDCGDMVDDCELIVANVVDEICNAIVYTCSPLKVLVPEDLDLDASHPSGHTNANLSRRCSQQTMSSMHSHPRN